MSLLRTGSPRGRQLVAPVGNTVATRGSPRERPKAVVNPKPNLRPILNSSPFEEVSLQREAATQRDADVVADAVEAVDVDADVELDAELELPTPTRPPVTKPPSLSDYSYLLQASARPQVSHGPQTCRELRPVGACLSQYLPQWKEITDDPWVLDVISNGYGPTFTDERPPLTREWWKFETIGRGTSPEKAALLQAYTQELLDKKAIEPVLNPQSLGHYSLMFLVTKKGTDKLRPIINLKPLNSYLDIPTFEMETTESVSNAVQPGDWGTSLDLTDAYFHVPMASWFKKYLRIVVNGKIYQYRALPFGLSTSPRVFTKMLQPVAVYLHSLGIHLHRFLDDFLIRSQSKEQCLMWTHFTLALLLFLGLGVSLEKSDLIPSQTFKYIGILFLTALGLMVPPEDRLLKVQSLGEHLLTGHHPASQWLSLLGLLGSAEKQVPFGRLHIRPIHFCVRRQFRIGVHPLHKLVEADQEARQAILWWLDRENTLKGQPLGQFVPDMTLNTDASEEGWGAHAPGVQASGVWPPDQNLSVNALELLAVIRALQSNPEFWKGKKVLIATDNTSTVAYINHQGATKSMTLMDLSYDLFHLVDQLGMTIKANHIPGRLNCQADLLSRQHQAVNTEWSLNPEIASLIWPIWGMPHLDLMATSLNHQLPIYVSPFPDPQAHAVDAMSLSWERLDGYVFPPWPLIHRVLLKMQLHHCMLTAIVPRWPNSPWFPLLLESLIDYPRRLPYSHDLLYQPLNELRHGAIHSLDLHVCRLSSTKSLIKAFQRKCLRESPREAELTPHWQSMIPSGRSSVFGVVNGISIHSMPLFQR